MSDIGKAVIREILLKVKEHDEKNTNWKAIADRRLGLLREVKDIIDELRDDNPNSEYLGELVGRLAKELSDGH